MSAAEPPQRPPVRSAIGRGVHHAGEIAARYGGEEFAVLLPDTTLSEAVALAESIRANVLALRADQQGRPGSTPTVNIGAAAMTPREGHEPRDLIKAADAALYNAKVGGRNRAESQPVRTILPKVA